MPTTLILGASDKSERFANQAQKKLLQNGHKVILVNPKGGVIDGIECFTALNQVKSEIDTVTIYVKPSILLDLVDEVIHLKPKRIIFNPGTENTTAITFFDSKNIKVVEDCTLVLLSMGNY